MDWLEQLLFDPNSIAHIVLLYTAVISIGIYLGKIKVFGISLGVTFVLFAGILAGHFGFTGTTSTLNFLQDFGLIIFVYCIGLQVGPGFFESFKKGGITLNLLACGIVALNILVMLVLYYTVFDTSDPKNLPMMVGVLCGAVTNTPGLGAAQQANSDLNGVDAPEIALGYAVAYPLGVIGCILSLWGLRYILRVKLDTEETDAKRGLGHLQELTVRPVTIEIHNESVIGKKLRDIHPLVKRYFVVSHIYHADTRTVEMAGADTVLNLNDKILLTSAPVDIDAITVFLGCQVEMNWDNEEADLVTRSVVITRSEVNGKMLSQLKIRNSFGANVVRVNRSGVDLVPSPNLQLQIGDRVMIVGNELAVGQTEKVLGNSLKQLNHPNLIPIFLGIALGCILGSIPFVFPGIPQPVKLGLAGGPLIVSILISRFGPQYKLITYTTMSANLMVREIGLSLFLACVGLGAGAGFVDTIVHHGGYVWIGYGVIITVVPLIIAGLVGRYAFKLNYYTLIGVLSGATTNPPALAYSNDQTSCDAPAVGYATVYPLTMFLRVLTAQLLILSLA